jgi:putative glutamine amidotransferase
MLKIGITPGFFYPDKHPHVHGKKTLTYIENDLAFYSSTSGIMPIMIPDLKGTSLVSFLEELDGIVFQGGGDMSPLTYGEEPIENGRWPGDPYRDKFELQIMDFAYFNKIPVLGICRGFQLLNVYFKGTLFQDLTLQSKTPVIHRDGEKYDKIQHQVRFTKNGLLEKIYNNPKYPLYINSVHHQGVKTLGKDLVVEAICPEDNLIEAFRHKALEERFILGIQWHPEFSHTLGDKILDPQPLLDYFIQEIKERRS